MWRYVLWKVKARQVTVIPVNSCLCSVTVVMPAG